MQKKEECLWCSTKFAITNFSIDESQYILLSVHSYLLQCNYYTRRLLFKQSRNAKVDLKTLKNDLKPLREYDKKQLTSILRRSGVDVSLEDTIILKAYNFKKSLQICVSVVIIVLILIYQNAR